MFSKNNLKKLDKNNLRLFSNKKIDEESNTNELDTLNNELEHLNEPDNIRKIFED